MIDGQNLFLQTAKNYRKTYENVRKNTTCEGDHYAAGCLVDYVYFKNYYNMIAIDLRK